MEQKWKQRNIDGVGTGEGGEWERGRVGEGNVGMWEFGNENSDKKIQMLHAKLLTRVFV